MQCVYDRPTTASRIQQKTVQNGANAMLQESEKIFDLTEVSL